MATGRKWTRRVVGLSIALTLMVGCSRTARIPAQITAASTTAASTTTATPGVQPSPDGWLTLVRQQQQEKDADRTARYVWLGDSITYRFAHELGQPTWDRYYAGDSLNLGVSGDTTQNVLWRIEHGALTGLHPQTVVVEIGTNNVGRATATAIALGIEKVAAEVAAALPSARVLVISVLPRSASPTDESRGHVDAINHALATATLATRVRFADIDAGWVTASGAQRADLFVADRLHLSAAGYEELAQEINPLLT